jgi:hypothetical protein
MTILVECLECDAEIWDNADKCHECGTPNCSVSDRKLLEALDKSFSFRLDTTNKKKTEGSVFLM